MAFEDDQQPREQTDWQPFVLPSDSLSLFDASQNNLAGTTEDGSDGTLNIEIIHSENASGHIHSDYGNGDQGNSDYGNGAQHAEHSNAFVPFNELAPQPQQNDAPQPYVHSFMPLMTPAVQEEQNTPQLRNAGVTIKAGYGQATDSQTHSKPSFPNFGVVKSDKPVPFDFLNFIKNAQNGHSVVEAKPFWEAPGPVVSDMMERFSKRQDWLRDNVDAVFSQMRATTVKDTLELGAMSTQSLAAEVKKPQTHNAMGFIPNAIHGQKTGNMWSMPLR